MELNIYGYFVNPVYDIFQSILIFAFCLFVGWTIKLAMEK